MAQALPFNRKGFKIEYFQRLQVLGSAMFTQELN